MVERYEVIIRCKTTGNRWSLMFSAESFNHAEALAIPYVTEECDEIIRIDKDYENA